jgi:hypothetical protein
MIPQETTDSSTPVATSPEDRLSADIASPTEPDQLFHLASTGGLISVDNTEPDLPPAVGGVPAFYYWKDAIAVGDYIHPGRRFSLNITRDRLDGYVTNFNRMQTNGVAVPILMDHTPTASSALGWIVSVKREGDRLLELHQFLGESARDIGLRNKVSLGIDPHFVDGKGNSYGEAIVHSAVTPVPVVPSQGEFEPVDLSDDHQGVITLSLDTGSDRPAAAGAAFAKSEQAAAVRSSGVSPLLSDIGHGRGDRATDSRDNFFNNASHRSAELHLAAQALVQVAAMKRDLALSRGAIDPAVASELFDLLVNPTNSATNTMLLSRSAGGSPIAIAVFDALSRNHPAPLGELTGVQVLSRTVPGDEGATDTLRERMIALASGTA